MKGKSILLWAFLSASVLYGCIGGKSSVKSQQPYTVDDNDTVYLSKPSPMGYVPISGAVYNAIDKQFIECSNGICLYKESFSNTIHKTVRLSPLHSREHDGYTAANTSNAVSRFDYYINDVRLFFDRHIVSRLMPKAMEKVVYKFNPEGNAKYRGSIKITTRNPYKAISDPKKTLYILNNIEISEKIFDAITPVYIRSLKRISDKNELKKFRRKNLKELVIVETFTTNEVIAPNAIYWTGDTSKNVYIVNGIKLDMQSFGTLDKRFFSEYYQYTEKSDGFTQFLKDYPTADRVEYAIIK